MAYGIGKEGWFRRRCTYSVYFPPSDVSTPHGQSIITTFLCARQLIQISRCVKREMSRSSEWVSNGQTVFVPRYIQRNSFCSRKGMELRCLSQQVIHPWKKKASRPQTRKPTLEIYVPMKNDNHRVWKNKIKTKLYSSLQRLQGSWRSLK